VRNLLELTNDQFDAGAIIVKASEVERLQSQIGDQDLVVVATLRLMGPVKRATMTKPAF
jgi:hypothetical protein